MFGLEFFKLIFIKTKLFCSLLFILNEEENFFFMGNLLWYKTALKHNQWSISVKKYIYQIVLYVKKKK